MIKVCRRVERRVVPVQLPEPVVDVRVPVPNVAEITLEVAVVDGIKAYDGDVKPYVCFGELVANEVVFSG